VIEISKNLLIFCLLEKKQLNYKKINDNFMVELSDKELKNIILEYKKSKIRRALQLSNKL
jgi:hypothetical protein